MSSDPDPRVLSRVDQLIQLRRHHEARAIVESYLAENPDDATAWAHHALALLPDNPATALSSAQRAVSLEPDRAWLHGVIANVAPAAGDPYYAVHAAQHAVMLDPLDPEGHRVLAERLSCFPIRRAEALQAAEEALRLSPDEPASWLTVGNVWFALGEVEKAEERYRAVLEREPDNEAAKHNLANCRTAERDHGNALRLLQEILASDPRAEGSRRQLDDAIRELLHEVLCLALPAGVVIAVVVSLIWGR